MRRWVRNKRWIRNKRKKTNNDNKKTDNDLIVVSSKEYKKEYNYLNHYINMPWLIEIFKECEVTLAGGAINSLFTNSEIHDLDLYFKSKEDLFKFVYKVHKDRGFIQYHITDKSLTFCINNVLIQCIYFEYFNDIQDLFRSFDFTICMGAFDFKSDNFIFDKRFFKDNTSRRIVINNTTAFPIVSGIRLEKYFNKGYTIDYKEMLKLFINISKLDLKDYNTFKSQIGGMYGNSFNNCLNVNDGEEFSIDLMLDKIENLDSNDISKVDNIVCVDSLECLVKMADLLKIKLKYFVWKGHKYLCLFDSFVYLSENIDAKKHELINIKDYWKFPIIRYKYVRSDGNDVYSSYYNPYFKYKVGEYISTNGHPLYCTTLSKINDCSYCDSTGHVLLKLRIDSVDDLYGINDIDSCICRVNKLYVEKAFTDREEKELRDEIVKKE